MRISFQTFRECLLWFLVLGLVAHLYFFITAEPTNDEIRVHGAGDRLVNPLLECADLDNISNKDLNTMKKSVRNYVDEAEKNGISYFSVYYRDLNNGPWFGIHEKNKFNPGSLLKVPLMMALLKEVEADPNYLQRKALFTKTPFPVSQHYLPKRSLTDGREYTILELTDSMIRYSDNDAASTLYSFLGDKRVFDTYTTLGIEIPIDDQYSISVRDYASFFRILYNATYLKHSQSEFALNLMTQTDFSEGISAPIPKNIKVAQKFGEKTFANSKEVQLHNCGIVYYPDHPYILCIMAKGESYSLLEKALQDISKIIYDQIDVTAGQ